MSSTAIEAPRADTTGSANTLVLSDTVIHAVTEPRPGTLTLDQRLALRHQLCELAELEEDRVERVATVGLEPVAAYEVGLQRRRPRRPRQIRHRNLRAL